MNGQKAIRENKNDRNANGQKRDSSLKAHVQFGRDSEIPRANRDEEG